MQDRDKLLGSIRDGMEVVDKAGTRIGTVTRVEGGHFKIVRPGQEPRNAHQFVSPDLIDSVGEKVVLRLSWDELRRIWSESDFAEQNAQQPTI